MRQLGLRHVGISMGKPWHFEDSNQIGSVYFGHKTLLAGPSPSETDLVRTIPLPQEALPNRGTITVVMFI